MPLELEIDESLRTIEQAKNEIKSMPAVRHAVTKDGRIPLGFAAGFCSNSESRKSRAIQPVRRTV